MSEKYHRAVSHRSVAELIRDADTFVVNVPGVGHVRIPRPEELAYYGALAALATFEVIDWPVALVVGAGHALASQHQNKVAQELGEALEQA